MATTPGIAVIGSTLAAGLMLLLAGLLGRRWWRRSIERQVSLREEALRLSHNELKHYFEQPFIGMLTANPAKGTVHVNQRFCDMVGYSKEEMQTLDWGSLTHPDDLAENQAFLDQAMRGEIDSYQMEKRYLHKDGHILYVDLAVNCVRNALGQPDYFIGMMLDITERKQAEAALLLESKKNETLLRTAGDGIHVLDMDGNVVQANEAFCDELGYTMEEMQTMNVAQWDAQWNPLELKRKITELMAKSATVETRHRRSDGSVIEVEINAVGVEIGGQSLLFCSGRDITRRKQSEASLLLNQSMLARTESLAHIGSWEWRVKTDTVSWSDELFRIFQLAPAEVAPSFADDPPRFPPEDMERFRIAVEDAVNKGLPYEIELRALQKHGGFRHCVARGLVDRGADGTVERLSGSFQDITEHKQLEARLAYDAKVNAALAALSQAMIKPAANIQEISETTLEVALSLTLSQLGYVFAIEPSTGEVVSHTTMQMLDNVCLSIHDMGATKVSLPNPATVYAKLTHFPPDKQKGFFLNQDELIDIAHGKLEAPFPCDGFLSMPALVEERRVGWIVLANPTCHYTDDDLGVAEQIAVVYASALQRKRIEDALAENEQRYRAVFENAAVGIARVAIDGQFLDVNQEFCRIIGYTQDEVFAQGLSYPQITYTEDIEVSQASAQNLLAGLDVSYTLEKRYVHKHGQLVWAVISVHLLRDKGGNPLYFIAAFQDITAHKQDEEQLQLAARVFESSGEAILVTDANNQILSVNPAFTAVTGYTFDEVIGKDPRLLKSGRHGVDFYRDLWSRLNEQGYWQGEVWNRRKNGQDFPVWQIISTVKDARVGVKNYVLMFIDITERHRIEQELIVARDAANASAKVKSEFLANMSHEIRTPMNGILGLTQLALEQPLTPKVRDYLEKILSSSDGLLKILNDILDYSKIEAGQMAIEDSAFDLDQMLHTLRNLFSYQTEEKSLNFVIEAAADVPHHFIGDGLRLRQVLINLLGNAFKFTTEGRVSLLVACKGLEGGEAKLEFRVIDTGIGMSEETVANLFRPFNQADASISRRFGGTGLGLAISDRLLEMLGGTFNVESRLGQGTCFSFEINLKLALPDKQSEPKADMGKLDLSPRRLTGARVLVAEDNPINQQVVCGMLQRWGICVGTASDGYEVLDLLAKEPFDVVLMDVQMPVMNGIEATIRLRKDPRFAHLPVIALTAGVTDAEKARALASGMNGFLGKPVDAEALATALAHWMPSAVSMGSAEVGQPSAGKAHVLQLAGFELDALQSALDNQTAVVTLLMQFRHELIASMEQIESSLAAHDIARADKHLHRLKGASGNVGARVFHVAAEALEVELKQGLAKADSLDRLREAYRATLTELDKLPADSIRHGERTSAGSLDFKAIVAKIDDLLTGNYMIPDELLDQLEASTPPRRLDSLRSVVSHIRNIDYKKARAALERLTEN